MRLRPSGFPVHPHWAGGAAPTEAGLLRDPWQNARWQHAIFLKVNNKTTAVSHLEKPGRPQGWEGSRRVPGAGPALLQSSTFLPGTDQWLSFPQPAMGASLPQQGSRCLLPGAPGLAWLIPQPGTLLQASVCSAPNSISRTGVQLPAIFPMGATGNRLCLPFPPTVGCLL